MHLNTQRSPQTQRRGRGRQVCCNPYPRVYFRLSDVRPLPPPPPPSWAQVVADPEHGKYYLQAQPWLTLGCGVAQNPDGIYMADLI
jgi:hypothetical protein